ncbi:MAG TPA: glycosyl transferase, partial [Syntrophobacteraceae bacterium]|nr:glycosyl transferase [Syntrophobacteraceae bacterium]
KTGLWRSRTIAETMTHHLGSQINTIPVAAAGYHEPSLVFLLGTDTKLLSADMAACYLQAHPQAAAVVSGEVESGFQ